MHSGKAAPLGSHATGGGGGESGLLAARIAAAAASPASVGLKRHRGTTTAENCDPNVVFHGENPRKSQTAVGLEGLRGCSVDESVTAETPTGESGSVRALCDASAAVNSVRQSKDFNGPAKSGPSPTKASVLAANAHQEQHGHRNHICRSPRCASNNPDYATPAQATPRKYLISKRHLLPGAICTRDPATLATRAQDSPQPAPPSAGKPPKPLGRRLETTGPQPQSPPEVSAVKTPSPLRPLPCGDGFPPTRIPRHSSARSPGLSPASAALQAPPSPLGSEARHSSPPEARQCPPPAEPPARPSTPPEAPPAAAAPTGGRAEHLSRLESDASCTVVMAAASVSSRASEALSQASDYPLRKSDSDLSTLEKLFLPTFADSRDSRSSSQSFADLEQYRISGGGASLSSSYSEQQLQQPAPEVDQVAAKLAENLALEKADAKAVAEAESAAEIGVSSDNVPSAPTGQGNDGMRTVEGRTVDVSPTLQSSVRPGDKGMRVEGEECQERDEIISAHVDTEHSGPESQSAPSQEQFSKKLRTEGDNFVEGHEHGDGGELQAKDTAEGNSEQMEKQQENARGRTIADFVANIERAQRTQALEARSEGPKAGGGKGRPLWQRDCRDSRELVFLKPTRDDDRRRPGGDWMVDSLLEGAISKLNGTGQGRVRVLVEAFESLMNLGGDADTPERRRRASRVWCLNRMEKGEVDEDGEEFEDGEQRVDCYEVSGDGLQLRASMRLSLEGGGRAPLCTSAETSEIEMSAIQKVQEWDDDCTQSATPPPAFGSAPESSLEGRDDQRREDDEQSDECSELRAAGHRRRISTVHFVDQQELFGANNRFLEGSGGDERTNGQLACYSAGAAVQRIENLDQAYKFKASRRRRFWRSRSSKSEILCSSSSNASADKEQRIMRATMLEPFRLLTEQRGAAKEMQFARKLGDLLAEEERLRNPIAQGLPWTTDEPEIVPKPPAKDQTRPVEFTHFSNWRAMERAEFDNYMAERCAYVEQWREEQDKLRQAMEEDEVKKMRREMVPRAQLMPFFDQPFVPSRSSKRLTVPKGPAFQSRKHKRAKCMLWPGDHQQHPPQEQQREQNEEQEEQEQEEQEQEEQEEQEQQDQDQED